MALRLKQASESLECLLKQSAGSRSLDSGGLGWGPRICSFNKSQVMPVLLMQGPHFENASCNSGAVPSPHGSETDFVIIERFFISQGWTRMNPDYKAAV